MLPKVYVVRTGTANLASVFAGIRRVGAEPELTSDPAIVDSAGRLVLPGVGAFKAAMDELNACGLVGPLRRRIEAGRPTLCICLGMQLLCRESEESPGVQGLGLIDATIEKFPATVRVPQLGWNTIVAANGCRFLADGAAYFANSYRLPTTPKGWRAAAADHGGPFVAALERDDVLACQFHPELSGEFGLTLLRRWLEGTAKC